MTASLIQEHSERGVYVAGLSMHVCHNVKDCQDLMNKGFSNRHVGSTNMNAVRFLALWLILEN